MTRSRSPFVAGDVVAGKYLIEQVVGSGGMGVVLRARHLLLEEHVALKVPLPELVQNARSITRFLREARAAARLRSEHVVRIRDVETLPDGTPIIVMELLQGRDLAALSKRDGPQPLEAAVSWVLEACAALAEAHAAGIVHRDIKPSNLFLATQPGKPARLVVLDFGVARISGGSASDLTGSSQILGSPLYMSPEQIRNAESVGPATDIWALGVVLYELLTQTLPFSAGSSTGVIAAIVSDRAVSLRERLPDVPETLERVVARCLEKDPALRFPSIVALAEALAPFTSGALGKLEAVRQAADRTPPPSDRTVDPILVLSPEPAPEQTASNWGEQSLDAPPVKRKRGVPRAIGLVLALCTIAGAIALFTTSRATTLRHERALYRAPGERLLAMRPTAAGLPVRAPLALAPSRPGPSRSAVRAPRSAAAASASAQATAVPLTPPAPAPAANKPRADFEVDQTVDTRR